MVESFQSWPPRSGSRAVEVDGDGGQPGPDEQYRRHEGQRGRTVRATGDPGESAEERDAGTAGEPRQVGPAVPGEVGAQHQAGCDQAEEADPAEGEMQRAVPAHGGDLRGTDREAPGRVGAEDSGAD